MLLNLDALTDDGPGQGERIRHRNRHGRLRPECGSDGVGEFSERTGEWLLDPVPQQRDLDDLAELVDYPVQIDHRPATLT